jgi:hypothetical protein
MKNMKWVLCFAIVSSLGWSVSSADDDQPTNLLTHGGFEKWMDWTPPTDPAAPVATVKGGRRPTDWDYEVEAYERKNDPKFPVTVTIFREEDIKHGGDYAVKIQNAAMTDIGGLTSSPPINVQPNTTYKVTVWYKGDNIVPNAGDGAGVVFWTGEAPTPSLWDHGTINCYPPKVKTGTFDWTSYEFTFTTKADTNDLAITAQLRRAQGTVWFDDFSMVVVKPAGPAPAPTGGLK